MQPGPVALSELAQIAQEAHDATGLSKSAAAERLGVSRGAYGNALNGLPSMDALRMRIIEAFSPYRVEGPKYELVKKGEAEG